MKTTNITQETKEITVTDAGILWKKHCPLEWTYSRSNDVRLRNQSMWQYQGFLAGLRVGYEVANRENL